MRTAHRVILPALWALLVVGMGCKAGPRPFPDVQDAPAAAVRVEFEPPLGKTVVERSTVTRVTGATEIVEATMHSRFERNEGGYVLTQQIPSVRVTRDGTAVDSPLLKLVTGFPLQIQLAKDGAFVRLLNPEDAEAAVRKTFTSPEEAEAILRFFTPAALEAQARREWSSRFGDLFERNLIVGSSWDSVETLETEAGQESYLLERKLEGTRPTDEGRELVLRLSCPASAEAAGNPDSARRALEAENVEKVAQVQCEGEQVVSLDPFVPKSTVLEVRSGPMTFRREVHSALAENPEHEPEVR